MQKPPCPSNQSFARLLPPSRRFDMSVPVHELNQLTTSKYGFQVADWDNRSISGDELFVLGKHEFHSALSTGSIDVKGEIFNEIFQHYKNCKIDGRSFQPTAIYLRLDSENKIPYEPFLFVTGVKV